LKLKPTGISGLMTIVHRFLGFWYHLSLQPLLNILLTYLFQQLYLQSDPTEANASPISWFEGTKYTLRDHGPDVKFERIIINPCIAVLPPAGKIVDEIVVSAILSEQKARWTRGRPSTNEAANIAEATAMPLSWN